MENAFDEMQREFLRSMEPSYLKTVSMSELYENVYQSRPPIIDGLLYPGTYLFVGAPKLGKSFLMAQLAYHVSTGSGVEVTANVYADVLKSTKTKVAELISLKLT